MTDKVQIASVAVEKTAYHFDKLYDYIVPNQLCEQVSAGCRVSVSFGKGGLRQGIIFSLHEAEDTTGLKKISKLLDVEPVLSKELLDMAVFMKNRYYCTLFDACSAMLPAGLFVKVMYSYTYTQTALESDNLSDEEQRIIDMLVQRKKPVRLDLLLKATGYADDVFINKMLKKGLLTRTEDLKKRYNEATVKMIRFCDNADLDQKFSPKQSEIISLIKAAGSVSVKEVCYYIGCTPAVADALVKKCVCEYFEEEPPRPKKEQEQGITGDIVLTQQQSKAYTSLLEKKNCGKPSVSLLYGITGSGKTSVFMKLIDDAFQKKQGVIVMVPEIALTPQLIAKFSQRYGDSIAVFHSALSIGKRLEEWKRVKNGVATIAIGTRSAIFAPFENLSLIVMDEEQEYTYKSSSAPRFHARDLAKFRSSKNNCLLLLSSATPSVESFYFATEGRYGLQTLTERYGSAKLPRVIVADMNNEIEGGNTSGYSSVLLEAIEDNLKNKKQSILLLNRRGHNTFVACRMCKDVIQCPNCSISMTYHSANNRLMCHYCGHSIPVPDECPSCHSTKLRYGGTGTQRAEEQLCEIFPEARVLRLDTDTTMQRYAYEKKLDAFASGEYDILLGTQMVAKGLDFPNVTLVGVLSADQMLYNGDFRSFERTFSLLTQVVGRSGRGGGDGRAIIQTYMPENKIISLAAQQNYDRFFESEIMLRRSMIYPPFADICVVAFVGENQKLTEEASNAFAASLKEKCETNFSGIPLVAMGPSAALVSKVNNKYRYRIILKFRNDVRFRAMMSQLLCEFGSDRKFSTVTAFADINPDSVM